MKSEQFYAMLDYADSINTDYTNGYFPTVEEFKANNMDKNIEKNIVLIAYFASNPFKRMGLMDADDPDYLEFVTYAKNLLETVKITD